MAELTLEATLENLEKVLGFVEEQLKTNGCCAKALVQVQIAVEEIYVNIVHYAYRTETGMVTIKVCIGGKPVQAAVTFIDRGIPYNPLSNEDPDTNLSAEKRKIGGLGIFIVKKSMDDVKYVYSQGQNILTICKSL